MGWDVLATDLPDVIDSVLARNVARNLANLPLDSGTIQIRALDWSIPPSEWTWEHQSVIASTTAATAPSERDSQLLAPPFDLIITSDTVYSTHLVEPLLQALAHLFTISVIRTSAQKARYPPLYVCIERRDPTLVEQFLASARRTFSVTRIPPRKVSEAMEKNGLVWVKEDWEGMEIWSFTKPRGALETL